MEFRNVHATQILACSHERKSNRCKGAEGLHSRWHGRNDWEVMGKYKLLNNQPSDADVDAVSRTNNF